MKYFNCDYNEGAHERILQQLVATNMEQTPGYGEDDYCAAAAAKLKELCQKEVDVHFLVGGTQTNLTLISSALRPHQAVIAADCGHINTHESGAIENCGHRVIALPSEYGKITAAQVEQVYREHQADENRIHTVQPKLVYISTPTEWGTVYSREELAELHAVCQQSDLLLYVDGARLAYGLAAAENTLSIAALAEFCDAFYIGGTKCGALFGEALVLVNDALKVDFRYLIKQKGAMLAKGRLLGLQFKVLFEDGLYEEIGQHGVRMAEVIRTACIQAGYPFYIGSGTNQVFPIMPVSKLEELHKKYSFLDMGAVGEGSHAVRFCTSWATKEEDVLMLAQDILQ